MHIPVLNGANSVEPVVLWGERPRVAPLSLCTECERVTDAMEVQADRTLGPGPKTVPRTDDLYSRRQGGQRGQMTARRTLLGPMIR